MASHDPAPLPGYAIIFHITGGDTPGYFPAALPGCVDEWPFWHGYAFLVRWCCVEGQIEPHDIDSRFTQDAELPAIGVLLDAGENLFDIEIAGLGDAGGLDLSVLHADVRIETAAGRSHGISRDKGVGSEAVFLAVLLDRRLHGVGELL